MPLQYPFYSVSFAAAALLVLAAALQAWTVRTEPGGRPLVVTLLGLAFWACCEFAVTLAPGTALAIDFMKLWYLGISVVIAGIFAFALDFTGYKQHLTRRTVALLAVWPVVFNGIVWLRPSLVWSSFVANPAVGSGWETTYGIAFGLNAGYSYLLVSVATVLLVRFGLTSKFLYQKQVAVLLAGIVAPWVTDLLFITRAIPYDLTAVGFAVTGITMSWAIQRTKFLDVIPVARDSVIERLTSSVFVIDSENRLVDSNSRGLELLDISESDIGRPMAELLEGLPAAAAELEAVADGTDDRTIQTEIRDTHYKIEITPLEDDRGDLVGRVFLVHDISDQTRRQTQLKDQNEKLDQQNDRLDQFAGFVSHDLRSPLTIASGHLGLARQTGDPAHFDEVERSHQRMEELIDQLLAFVRLDDEIETTAVDAGCCAQTAWKHVDTEAADLTVDVDTEIDANREYLLQLLQNLIRNSIEHGGPDVTVSVTLEKPDADTTARPADPVEPTAPSTTDTTQLRVSDDGSGIPVDQRQAVLEEGYTTGSDGVGVGLSIVSEIADAHDWAVRVEESASGGAAFVFDGVEHREAGSA